MLKKTLFVLWTAVSLFILSAYQADASAEKPDTEQVREAETFIKEQFKESGIIGGSYAIVYQDQLLAAGGVGYSDKERKKEATEETVYASASVTKSLTATAIYQLDEQGKLDIHDPVKKYIPWFTYADEELSERVTIWHLLTHSAGVSRYEADGSIYTDEQKNRNSIENGVKALKTVPMNAAPGEKGQYCNTCYNTLGLVIEKVSGLSYSDYMEQFIFEPLNMNETVYGSDLKKLSADIAKEYSYLFGFETDRLANYSTFGKSQDPEGGIYTNAADLAKFVSSSLGYGEAPLLTVESQKSIFKGSIPSEQKPWHYTAGAYAAGEIAGEEVVYKGGDGIGSASGIWLLPEKDLGIVMLVGQATGSVYDIGSGVISVLAGGQPEPIDHSLNFFQMIGYAMAALTVINATMITRLIVLVCRRLRGRNKYVQHRYTAIAGGVILLTLASVLSHFLFKARLTQAGFYGFPVDMAVGLTGLIIAFLLWAAYGFYLGVFGRSSPQPVARP